MVKVGKYDYQKSTRKDKKLMVEVNGKIIHFGNPDYQQYYDKTGIWKSKNHNNKERRKNYLLRAKGIKYYDGKLTFENPESANYHSITVLW